MIDFQSKNGKLTLEERMAKPKKSFQIYSLIDRKKRGGKLTSEEIKWIIDEYTHGRLPDYQMSALLMAIYFQNMDVEETAALTDAMLDSGAKLKFKGKNVIDKHSTGGVGDKASFILAPIAAAAGVKVPMIAGRGLGHTGGTIDKVEAIKGFKTALNLKEFEKRLKKDGLVLIGQTPEIAPADRLIYALRDVTATIDSVPIITASIMSKKLAEGANGMVFDIKVGSGAFMRTQKDARTLAKSLVSTAKRFKKGAVAVLTDMDQPLGKEVGHSNEIIESIETLKGRGPEDLTKLSLILAAHMIHIGGKAKTFDLAMKKAKSVLEDGSALEEFRKLLKSQGGDSRVVDDYSLLPMAQVQTHIKAPKSGFIKSFDNKEIGLLLIELGGGRREKTDKIDHAVGFTFHKKIGDQFKKGDLLMTITHHESQLKKAKEMEKKFLKEIVSISTKKVPKQKLILEKI
jgi:pyrimidine-nucleoside phosphorylase